MYKIQNWFQILKNIYDSFPKIKIIFSWSSSLDLKIWNYDLFRRASLYDLYGFSFREYINYNYKLNFSNLSLDEVLKNYYEKSIEISNII